MDLISFNISNNIIKLKKNSKKYLLFDHSCKNIKNFNNLNTSYSVAKIHELKKKKEKIKQLNYLDKTYYLFLKYLTNILNKSHNKKYSEEFWQFLLNQWLHNSLRQAYSRWLSFDKIKKKYKIEKFYKINFDYQDLIPQNSYHSRLMQVNFDKNNLEDHFLISKIVEFRKEKKINIINIKKKINLKNLNKIPVKFDKNFYLSKNNQVFFYKFQLPTTLKLKLLTNFKFFNFKLYEKLFYIKKKNSVFFNRNKLFKYKKRKNFVNFFKYYIKFSLPKIFLENFKELQNEFKNTKFPKKPKNILTSYPQYDEIFKYYCSKNLKNSNIMIFQHGYDNVFKYDHTLYKYYPVKYFSWGSNQQKNLFNFFFTKNYSELRNFKFKKKNKIQLVLTSFPERENKLPFGYSSNFESNQRLYNLSFKLLKKLNKNLLKEVNVKTQDLTKFPVFTRSLKQKFPNIKFIGMEKLFGNIIFNYNLNIFFRIGTPLFESVYLNRPFIWIFDEKIEWEPNNKLKYFIEEFKKNNICFVNPLTAAKFINKQYYNTNQWWNSENVQTVLKEFSLVFCKRFDSFKEDMKKIIK